MPEVAQYLIAYTAIVIVILLMVAFWVAVITIGQRVLKR